MPARSNHFPTGAIFLAAGLLVGTLGCPPETFPNATGLTLIEVNQILNNNNLTPQEQRAALLAAGISETTANGLLRNERLANQFGGSLTSAYEKVVAAEFSELTPDEIQYYADAVAVADDNFNTTVSDAQSQALADFFSQNAVDSPADVSDFLNSPTAELPADVDEDTLQAVFVDFDPDGVTDQLP